MWKIGTRVRIIKGAKTGITGTVVIDKEEKYHKDERERFLVEFDEPMDGNIMTTLYDCKPNCWWWFDNVPGRIVETDGITIEKIGKRKNNYY